jgi:hypothetical protein
MRAKIIRKITGLCMIALFFMLLIYLAGVPWFAVAAGIVGGLYLVLAAYLAAS